MKKSVLIVSLIACILAVGVLLWWSTGNIDFISENSLELTQKTDNLNVGTLEVNSEWTETLKKFVENTFESAARFVFSVIYK